MIAHVVLCTLRADLAREDRARFARTVADSLCAIPAIRRSIVGRRVKPGIPYPGIEAAEYDYMAVLEFDDETALHRYLDHPAHADLASAFRTCCARTLVADYQLLDPATLDDPSTI